MKLQSQHFLLSYLKTLSVELTTSRVIARCTTKWATGARLFPNGSRLLCGHLRVSFVNEKQKKKQKKKHDKKQKQRRSVDSPWKNINTKIVLYANSITLLLWPWPSHHRIKEQTNTTALDIESISKKQNFSTNTIQFKYHSFLTYDINFK